MAEGTPLARLMRPASLVTAAAERLFRQIPLPDAWITAATNAASRGSLVYVLKNVSLVDLLALEHITERVGLPRVGFANELDAWLELPTSLRKEPSSRRIDAALRRGSSAVLFMKRPPDMLDRASATHRGRSEGDEPMRALFTTQRRDARDVLLLPLTFVWTTRPSQLGFSVVDTVFGPSEYPGDLRAVTQLLLNYKHGVLRAGEPVNLREFLAHEEPGARGDDSVLAKRLTYALLRKLERERRSILGPAQKPADRVREEVLRSPKLQAAIRDVAAGGGEQARARAETQAREMLRQMQTDPNPQTLRGLEAVADTLVDRVYSGVDVDEEGIERARAAARLGSLVLLPSHKSHVDYVLLSYVLRKHALQIPVIAAGDNLAFFPVGPLIRRAGAFFIRRSFKGDRLYTAAVDAYIRRLLRDGFAIEFFLEGGRSRTGKLLPPKLGLLNMVVDAALSLEGRRVFFVPVSIGYERMMEEGSYARELSGEGKRKEDAAELLKLGGVLRQKYGRVNMQFGQIIELADLRAKLGLPQGGAPVLPAKRRALVTKLAHQAMSEMNRVTAVAPGSLVAMALLSHNRRGLPHAELRDQCARLMSLLRRLGARLSPSLAGKGGSMREAAIRDAIAVYVRGGIVHQHVPGDTLTGKVKPRSGVHLGDDVIYRVPDEKRLVLDISKNIIVHFFVDRALISVALLSPPRSAASSPGEVDAQGAPLAELEERVRSLSRLFKFEFMFRADAPYEVIFRETIAAMVADGELVMDDGGAQVGFGRGRDGQGGRGWISFYASIMRSFLEAYRIAARAARMLVNEPLAEKELVPRALRVGELMFLGGEIDRSEAVSRPVIENALTAFVEQGYLKRAQGKLSLAEPFVTDEASQGIEARIAGYLRRRMGDGRW